MRTRLFLLIALMMVTSVAMGQAAKKRQRGVQQPITSSSQQPAQQTQQPVQQLQPVSNTPPSSTGEIEKQEQYDQYIEAAKAGDAVAEERVANSHVFPSKGYLYWLTRSAEHGYQGAQNVLAYCYNRGYGVEKDQKKAFYWWLKSAEQGNAASQSAVGDMYLDGKGTEKNEEKAYYWYQKGAEQNEPHCLVMMGSAYEGEGIIPADPVKSFNCFKKAADLDYETALPQVAFRYFYGDGVAQDYGQAAYWFDKSIAKGGDPEDVQYWKEMSAKAKMRQQIKDKQKK